MSKELKITIIAVIIVILLTLLAGFGANKIMDNLLDGESSNKNSTTSVGTNPNSNTATNSLTDTSSSISNSNTTSDKLEIKDFIGQWYNSEDEVHGTTFTKELDILEVNDSTLKYNIYLYNSGYLEGIIATINDDKKSASFSVTISGALIEGVLMFEKNKVTLEFTNSEFQYISANKYEFNAVNTLVIIDDKYLATWYNSSNTTHNSKYDTELKILNITDSEVIFSIYNYELGTTKEITASLKSTVASFNYSEENVSLVGYLTFYNESVSLTLTSSSTSALKADTYSLDKSY